MIWLVEIRATVMLVEKNGKNKFIPWIYSNGSKIVIVRNVVLSVVCEIIQMFLDLC